MVLKILCFSWFIITCCFWENFSVGVAEGEDVLGKGGFIEGQWGTNFFSEGHERFLDFFEACQHVL